ncbi:peptidase family C50-domain-containing protein [Phlyctochytrium arcticum]|nr:peptidase family C50-domain-containing protein [Phlyctochytrium arcticum]
MKVMGSSPKYSMFFDAAFSLPWGVPDQTRLGKASKAEKALQTLREHIFKVLEIFKEAFTLAATSGTPQVLHELAHGMCFLNVLRAYIAPGAASDIPNLVLESAFYLEMAKGVTPRREMLAKLVKQEQKLLPKATWPTVNEDFQERTPSGQLLKLYQDEISSTPMDFREQILDRLPDSWVVVSLSVDLERQDLYLVRYEARCEPVLVRLPLSRQAMREGEESGVVYKIVIDELHDILRESNSMTKSGQACSTKEEIAEWWKSRRELDSRMQLLTESIENSWLGAFKGLLSTDDFDIPELSEATQQFKKTLERIVYKGVAQKGNSRRKKPALLEIEANLCRMLLRLGATPSDEDVEDALYYLMDAYQYSGINIDYDEMDIDAMEIEIKDAIEQFHQQHALHSQNSQVKPEQKHLILIPDKHLHMLPWEALPTLFDKPTSRLPCLSFLRDILRETNDVGHSIDPSNAHYILNPTNDLDATQKQFSPFVTSQEGWTGTIGEVPTEKQWLEGLEDRELFVYFGHGGGEQYARGYCIREMAKCAVTLLLGCSSGCLRSAGEFDPSGTPLHYMFAGSRAIVATLWDVTDRDLDRFSMSLFEKWGLIESGETSSCKVSLSAAVARSRGSCTLKYLTGAAPVVYGVPIFFNEKAQ